MNEINLIGGFYKSKSLPFSAQDVVNWLPVPSKSEAARSPIKLRGLPGLAAFNPPIVVITQLTLTGDAPDSEIGTSYSFSYTAAGGVGPYTFSVFTGSLPDGLSLSSAGVITGTPTTSQTSTFTVLVVDSDNNSRTLEDTIRISSTLDVWALLHFDGNFSDDTGKTWTQLGSPTTGAPSRFGSGSSNYTGGGNGLRSPLALNYPAGLVGSSAGDWTAEFWVYIPANIASYQPIFHIDGGSGQDVISLRISQPGSGTNELYFGTSASTGAPIGYAVPLTQWVHVAVCRKEQFTRVFCGGVLVNERSSGSQNMENGGIYLGRIDRLFGSSTGFSGRIDEFRFVLGSALYTANFTPPTAPFTL